MTAIITRIHHTNFMTIVCDDCANQIQSKNGKWKEFYRHVYAAGWKVFKADDKFKHNCPSCNKKALRKFVMKETAKAFGIHGKKV